MYINDTDSTTYCSVYSLWSCLLLLRWSLAQHWPSGSLCSHQRGCCLHRKSMAQHWPPEPVHMYQWSWHLCRGLLVQCRPQALGHCPKGGQIPGPSWFMTFGPGFPSNMAPLNKVYKVYSITGAYVQFICILYPQCYKWALIDLYQQNDGAQSISIKMVFFKKIHHLCSYVPW